MNVRPEARSGGNISPPPALAARDVAGSPQLADHAGLLDGATATGEASRQRLSVRIGLWLDGHGRVQRARWRAVKDPELGACAEIACSLLESGLDPLDVDDAALRSASPTVATMDAEIREVVAEAIQAGAAIGLSARAP
jgi:hypothetical protein